MKSHAMAFFLLVSGSLSAGIDPGTLVPSVTCEAEPDYGYALYLPSSYDPGRPWPLILAFDPSGIGRQPVEGLQAAAERYGYIVAGSNDSRNYTSWEFKMAAAAAVWRDVASRFSVDPKRVYTTGFSGGARVATEVALKTGAVAGVLAVGGGFRLQESIEGSIPFVLAGASGTRDMNHREMQQVHARLLERGLPTRHLVFAGTHQWPPTGAFTEAVEWFELQAMRRGLRPAETAHLETLYETAIRNARSGDAPEAQLTEYEQIARDYEGLVDLTDLEPEIARLRGNPAVRRAEKERQRWIRHEDSARVRLVAQMRNMEAAVDDAGRRAGDLRDLRRELDRIVRDKESDDIRRADSANRLLGFVSTVGFERGIVASQNSDYGRAALFYEIALQAVPESRGLRVRLAGMYARQDRLDRALKTLAEAIDLGLADADRLRDDEHLEPLRSDPRFAALLAGMDEALK